MRRIGEHLANPDLNTINNSNLEQWPEVWAGRQTSNNFVFDRKMVGLWRNFYFATRFKLSFVKKWGHLVHGIIRELRKEKKIVNF